jgi:hypothetical protein
MKVCPSEDKCIVWVSFTNNKMCPQMHRHTLHDVSNLGFFLFYPHWPPVTSVRSHKYLKWCVSYRNNKICILKCTSTLFMTSVVLDFSYFIHIGLPVTSVRVINIWSDVTWSFFGRAGRSFIVSCVFLWHCLYQAKKYFECYNQTFYYS